jgi:hypothetical protein
VLQCVGTTALAFVRGGQTDSAAVSTRTRRGARAHQPRRPLEVRARLTHTEHTPRLRGLVVVLRRMVEARRRSVDARTRATLRWRVPGPDALHVPLFGRAMLNFCNVTPSNRR